MSKTNRNLQAKYRKACAQRVEASIAYRTLAPIAVVPDHEPKVRPAKTWDEVKPKAFWKADTRVAYVPRRVTPKVTAYEAACAPAGQVTLYRDGVVVA